MNHNVGTITRILAALPLLVGCDIALDAPGESAVVTTSDVATTTEAQSQGTPSAPEPPVSAPHSTPPPAANPATEPVTPATDDQGQQNQGSPPAPGSESTDEGGEAPADTPTPTEPPAKASIFDGGSAPTPWTTNGTSKMPQYGEDCRLTTDTVFEAATNGLADDSLSFVVYSPNEATLDLEVVTAQGLALAATVDLTRGLPDRSFRDAEGWATFEYAPGMTAELPVIDGTLCFAQKLSEVSGDDVLAEFSFIVVVNGAYHSMGGNVLIPKGALSNFNGVLVDASQAVDIDLR